MGRAIGSAVAGYVVMFVIVFVGLTLAWLALGADGAFRTGTWRTSTGWVVTMLLVGLVAAVAGGWVARRLGGDRRAVLVLVALVVLFGLVDIAMSFGRDPGVLDAVRVGEPSMFEAMGNARPPAWFSLVNVVVAVAGVLIGARLQNGETSRRA